MADMRARQRNRNAHHPTPSGRTPKILSERDFVEEFGYLVPREPDPNSRLLIIAHSNLVGTQPAADEHDRNDSRGFLRMLLEVVPEFPELRIGLLDGADEANVEVTRRFGSMSQHLQGLHCEALISFGVGNWRNIQAYGDETPESIRLWIRGPLMASGLRPTRTREDLAVRLAYEFAQPEMHSFTDARWDVASYRLDAYEAAKKELHRMMGSPADLFKTAR